MAQTTAAPFEVDGRAEEGAETPKSGSGNGSQKLQDTHRPSWLLSQFSKPLARYLVVTMLVLVGGTVLALQRGGLGRPPAPPRPTAPTLPKVPPYLPMDKKPLTFGLTIFNDIVTIEYKGDAADGVADGYGIGEWNSTLHAAAGKYVGGWKDNKPEGEGNATYAYGRTYAGRFEKGALVNGTSTLAGGISYSGTFTPAGVYKTGTLYTKEGRPFVKMENGRGRYCCGHRWGEETWV